MLLSFTSFVQKFAIAVSALIGKYLIHNVETLILSLID